MKIGNPQRGRLNPDASQQAKPDRVFGNAVERPMEVRNISSEAFGDSSGQRAMAEAMAKAGQTFFNIAEREHRLKQATDDAALQEKDTEFGLKEKELRLEIDQKASEEGWDADQIESFYKDGMEQLRETVYGDVDRLSTISPETISKRVEQRTKDFELAFRAGRVERARVQDFKTAKTKTIGAIVDGGHVDGHNNDVDKLQGSLRRLEELSNDPAFLALYGGEGVDLIRRSQWRYLENFAQSLAKSNLNDAKALLDPDGVLAKYLPEDVAVPFREDLQKFIDSEELSIRQETDQRQYKKFGAAKVAVAQGKLFSTAEIMRMDINDHQRATLIRSMNEAHTSRKTTAAVSTDVAQKIARFPGYYLNADDAASRKDVDTFWAAAEQNAFSQLPPEQQVYAKVDMVKQLGKIPTEFYRELNSYLLSTDPKRVQKGALIIKELEQHNEIITRSISPELRSIATLVDAGMPPEVAREQQRDFHKMTKDQRKMIHDAALEVFPMKDMADFLSDDDHFGDWTGINDKPQIPDAAVSDYRELYQSYYARLGSDSENAKKLALADLKRSWGRTNIDGTDRIMRYAPEAFYNNGTGGEQEWMRTQLEQDLQAAAGYVPEKFRLIVNPKSKGSKPTYFVLDIEQGRALISSQSGKPLEWVPDWKSFNDERQSELSAKEAKDRKWQAVKQKHLQEKTGNHALFPFTIK